MKRHHFIVRATHGLNALLLAGMVGSGLQIYGAYPHFGTRDRLYPVPNPLDGRDAPGALRLGDWLAGGLNWHFALAGPLILTGLIYLVYLLVSGEWRALAFGPRDIPRAFAMQMYYFKLRKEHPPQGKHNALQKGAYSAIIGLGTLSVLTGLSIYKPVQFAPLTALFGGFELARYWHFLAVWLFVAFILVHVFMVIVADPASFRAIVRN